MRTARFSAFFILAVLWSATTLRAQQPTTPEPSAAPTPVPSADNNYGYPDIESLRDPGSSAKLFPDHPTATPDPNLPGANGAGRRAGGGGLGRQRGGNRNRRRDAAVSQADADPLQVRVAYRRAKTLIMARDPGLADLLARADRAGTDPEKRAFLKQYYVRLYDEVGKTDPSPEMKKHLVTLKLIARARYEPRRREVGGDEDIVEGRDGRGGRGRRR